MINDKVQKQEGGDNSTNWQAQNITIINQSSPEAEMKAIALQVFMQNFLILKDEAAKIATARAEEVTEKIFSKLSERHPSALSEFSQPAMQDSLFNVQKQFAKSGDVELGDLLVDILVDRANAPKRNMLQIVLDESLTIAPKLTLEQLDILTLNFILVRTRRLDISRYNDFVAYINRVIVPFAESLTKEHTNYTHIEYLGCGHVRAGDYGDLVDRITKTYRGFFSHGFTQADFEVEFGSMAKYEGLVTRCFHDISKWQLAAFDETTLVSLAENKKINGDDILKLKNLFEKSTMPIDVVKGLLIKINPVINKVFDIWDNTPFNSLELTSVGVAIAHANYRRRLGESLNLEIWIK